MTVEEKMERLSVEAHELIRRTQSDMARIKHLLTAMREFTMSLDKLIEMGELDQTPRCGNKSGRSGYVCILEEGHQTAHHAADPVSFWSNSDDG